VAPGMMNNPNAANQHLLQRGSNPDFNQSQGDMVSQKHQMMQMN
jgi:hypothetical protein